MTNKVQLRIIIDGKTVLKHSVDRARVPGWISYIRRTFAHFGSNKHFSVVTDHEHGKVTSLHWRQ